MNRNQDYIKSSVVSVRAYLLKSENMKRRLSETKERQDSIAFEEACEKLGI